MGFAVAVAAQAADAWAPVRHEDVRADDSVDETLLLELDELLADPVWLGAGEVSRLRVLPWLGSEHIASLRAASATRSLAELAALPAWDAEAARRTQPFIRFPERTVRQAPLQGVVRTAALRGRRDVAVDISFHGLRAVGRSASSRAQPARFGLSHETARTHVLAGDLRVRHAQGLLQWSGEERAGATNAVVRSPAGAMPSMSFDRERTLRGAVVEVRYGVLARLVAGRSAHGRVSGFVARVPGGALGVVDTAVLRTASRAWSGAAWSLRTPRADAALEWVHHGGRNAFLAAAAWRRGRGRLGARFQQNAPGALPPWSKLTSVRRRSRSQHALVQARVLHRATRIELATAVESRRDSLGARVEVREHVAHLAWSQQPYRVELRLRQRSRSERDIGVESFGAADESRTRSLVLRLQTVPRASTRLGVEYRAVENRRLSDARIDTGSAWVLRVDQSFTWASIHWVASSFVAPSGRAAPYVAEPHVAGALSSVRVLGDGIRLATGVTLGNRGVRLRARGATVFTRRGRAGLDVETSLTLRLR